MTRFLMVFFFSLNAFAQETANIQQMELKESIPSPAKFQLSVAREARKAQMWNEMQGTDQEVPSYLTKFLFEYDAKAIWGTDVRIGAAYYSQTYDTTGEKVVGLSHLEFDWGVPAATSGNYGFEYGISGKVSPGVPTDWQETTRYRNNFLGYSQLAAYGGVVTSTQRGAFGAKLIYALNTSRYDEGGKVVFDYGNTAENHLAAFAEAAIYPKVRVGLRGSFGKVNGAIDWKAVTTASDRTEYASSIYSTYQVDNQTSVELSASSLNEVVPYVYSSNEMGLSFTRSL